MKKKIIAVATVFVVALVAAYGVYNNQNKNALADLMLDNVEALAQSESMNCSFGFVSYDQYANVLHCSGNGGLCCR